MLAFASLPASKSDFRYQRTLEMNSPRERMSWITSTATGSIPRRRGIEPVAVEVIHDILSRGEFISRVRWYRKSDFDAGNEANASTQPDAA